MCRLVVSSVCHMLQVWRLQLYWGLAGTIMWDQRTYSLYTRLLTRRLWQQRYELLKKQSFCTFVISSPNKHLVLASLILMENIKYQTLIMWIKPWCIIHAWTAIQGYSTSFIRKSMQRQKLFEWSVPNLKSHGEGGGGAMKHSTGDSRHRPVVHIRLERPSSPICSLQP